MPESLSPKGLAAADPAGLAVLDGPLPVMVLKESSLQNNIRILGDFCSRHQAHLAPHAKTTMSPELIRLQMDGGAWGMTAATAWQAARVAAMGVGRIIIANEVVDRGSLTLLGDILRRHPDIHLWAYVDSSESLTALESIAPDGAGRLGVLLELGVLGGRTGIRDHADVLRLAGEVVRGPLPLSGIAGFEGVIPLGDGQEAFSPVDAFLQRIARAAADLRPMMSQGTLGGAPLITVGGSAYPDRVAEVLAATSSQLGYELVLRSGCYLTHDDGAYDSASPFGSRPREHGRLQPSLELWAPVLSRPEPTRAIAGFGKRDSAYDAGLPIVRYLHDGGSVRSYAHEPRPTVVTLNDQHAYLDVDASDPLAVGQLVGFGISHPCTAFDKWRAIPVVDDDYRVVWVAHTEF